MHKGNEQGWSRWLNLINLSGRPCVCEWSMTALATHSRTRQVNGEHSASEPVGKEGLLGRLLLFSGLVTDKLTARTRLLPEWRCKGWLGLHLFWDLELSGRLGYYFHHANIHHRARDVVGSVFRGWPHHPSSSPHISAAWKPEESQKCCQS